MSTVKSKKLQVGTDASASNNFTIYQPSTPDGTLRIGVGNADSPTEVGQFNANGYKPDATKLPRIDVNIQSHAVAAATWTKMQFNDVLSDTTSNYDTTNYRWTPNVAGYYLIIGILRFGTTSDQAQNIVTLYKNGALEIMMGENTIGNNVGATASGSHIIYMNGTTDYLEIFGYCSYGCSTMSNTHCRFEGYLIQQA